MDVGLRRRATRIVAQLTLALAATLAGCRTAPNPSIELLESELRWMEDQLYEMDRQLDEACLKLSSCQRDNSSLRRQLEALHQPGARRSASSTANGARSPSDANASPEKTPDDALPAVDVPDVEELNEQLEIPDVELGPNADSIPEWSPERDPTPPTGEEDSDDVTRLSLPQLNATTEHVATIAINRRLTGGYNFDGQPGDEGLLVVVEPRNVSGQFVPVAGQLSIKVVEMAGAATPVAQWDFSATETRQLMKESMLGKGVHLQLPWPNRPPRSRKLNLSVTYTLASGTKVSTQRRIQVDLVGPEPNKARQTVASDPRVPGDWLPDR